METTISIGKNGILAGAALGENVRGAYGVLFDSQRDELDALIEKTQAAIAHIDADRGLNPSGKGERIAKVRESAGAELMRLAGLRRRKIEQELAEATEAIPQRLPKPDNDIRQREIRDGLRGMSTPAREAAIVASAEAGDLEVLQSLEHDPLSRLTPLVRPDVLDRAKESYWRAAKPEAVKSAETSQRALNLYMANLNRAAQVLKLPTIIR